MHTLEKNFESNIKNSILNRTGFNFNKHKNPKFSMIFSQRIVRWRGEGVEFLLRQVSKKLGHWNRKTDTDS